MDDTIDKFHETFMKRIERKTLVAVIIIVVLFTSWTDLEKYIEEYLKGFEEFLKYV